MTIAARRAAVLGHPVAHSLSPTLHRAAYEALGLDWSYDAVDVEAEELPAFLAQLDASWAGLSLTMPHKQSVIPLLDHVEPLAELVGAVNTVLVQAGARGSTVLTGANTDVYGIVAALREGADAALPPSPRGVVLGSGATAASSLAALGELGCSRATVFARSLARVGSLRRAAHRMGLEPDIRVYGPQTVPTLLAADVVVATAPAHGLDELAGELGDAVVDGQVRLGGVLLDVIYEPRPTTLMSAWRAAGGRAVGGERMLLHQAAEQVRLMTGRVAPLEAMDTALRSSLV